MSKSRLADLLSLSEVKRWNSRVKLLRPQSVAEHTFNVMAIAYELVVRLDMSNLAARVEDKHRVLYRVLRWGLIHDGPEAETGDVNFLFKRNFGRGAIDQMEAAACPWYEDEQKERIPDWARSIVKIADKIEEYLYIKNWCLLSDQPNWIPGILDQISDHCAFATAAYGLVNLPNTICSIVDNNSPDFFYRLTRKRHDADLAVGNGADADATGAG